MYYCTALYTVFDWICALQVFIIIITIIIIIIIIIIVVVVVAVVIKTLFDFFNTDLSPETGKRVGTWSRRYGCLFDLFNAKLSLETG